MAIDQTAIASEREVLKGEIADLEKTLKRLKDLYSEWNKVSALMGGPSPSTNGKKKVNVAIKRRCPYGDYAECTEPSKTFTTKAALSRHVNKDHGGYAEGDE